jgi:hypothetical protein
MGQGGSVTGSSPIEGEERIMRRTVYKWADIDGLSVFRREACRPAVFPIRPVSPTRSITLLRSLGASPSTLGLDRYILVLQDCGGPVGPRLAIAHPSACGR